MANHGKYVLSQEDQSSSDRDLERDATINDAEENSPHEDDSSSTSEASDNESGGSERGSAYSTESVVPTSEDDGWTSSPRIPYIEGVEKSNGRPEDDCSSSELVNSEQANANRMKKIEEVLAALSNTVAQLQPGISEPQLNKSNLPTNAAQQPLLARQSHLDNPETDQSWNFGCEALKSRGSYTTVRPEHIKPFPNGVRPNKMWAEWHDFIDNFEVAVSLHHADDPVYKLKLLYLSLGQELQAIVKAANLRPSLTESNCYTAFVKNIATHLRSMTDTAAEHRAFLKMKQGKDESTVAFHARLIRNVKLCGYSTSDQSRFVRAQLLDGLRNKELVKAARIYGYDTNFIVQSSTRDEAYEAETSEQSVDTNIFEIDQRYRTNRKRINAYQGSDYLHAKQRRTSSNPPFMQNRWANPLPRPGNVSLQYGNNSRSQGQRSRCPRCNNTFHRNPQCPALSRTCNNCGKVGHFAIACRTVRSNKIHQIANHHEVDSNGEENNDSDKQVKQG